MHVTGMRLFVVVSRFVPGVTGAAASSVLQTSGCCFCGCFWPVVRPNGAFIELQRWLACGLWLVLALPACGLVHNVMTRGCEAFAACASFRTIRGAGCVVVRLFARCLLPAGSQHVLLHLL